MTATSALAPAAFEAVVGAAHVRAATGADAVQGVTPSLVVEPGGEAEVAATLAEASRQRLRVVVRGGGTMLDWGAPPRGCDLVLSTRRLDALVEHHPGDLICVAGAGKTLAGLQAALSGAEGHRQRVMLDPPGATAGATLGGIAAAGASGPLRTRYGTLRNLLIGARFVLADGTVGHAGGKVVKNVAGYDVGKLLIGSLGTLAVITQVALRLHPLAPVSRWVVVDNLDADGAAGAVAEVGRLPVTPSTVEVVWPDRLGVIRVDSSEAGAERQTQLIRDRVGGRILDGAGAEGLTAALKSRPWQGDGVVAGISVPRRRLAALLGVAGAQVDELLLRGPLGVGEARLAADPRRVSALREAVAGLGGHLVLHRAPPELGSLVWPAAAGAEVELMRAVKASLDPGGTLAPGRHLGDI